MGQVGGEDIAIEFLAVGMGAETVGDGSSIHGRRADLDRSR